MSDCVMPDQISFDICIVNFNTKELTKVCIEKLKKATEGMACDIWVVDNGSTDGSVQMLESVEGIRFVPRTCDKPEEGHIAHAIAIDLVFNLSQKEYLILMHTDTIVHDRKAVLLLLESAMHQAKFGAAGCVEQVYYGKVGGYVRKLKKRVSYLKKLVLFRMGLRSTMPKAPVKSVHIRSFFSIWHMRAMREEGLCFNMNNMNPGYAAQDVMTGLGYSFVSIPPETIFRDLDHLEAATVAQVNPYHFKHRQSKVFKEKLHKVMQSHQ